MRRGAQEALVVAQVRDLEELPEVALQIRCDVRPKKVPRLDRQIRVELGEAAAHQEFLDGQQSTCCKFCDLIE